MSVVWAKADLIMEEVIMPEEKQENTFGKVVAKAWQDEGFKQKLLSTPGEVLTENGLDVPGGQEVRVVENTDKVVYFVLPPKPKVELSEEKGKVTGGKQTSIRTCELDSGGCVGLLDRDTGICTIWEPGVAGRGP
jgi:hypothetical protein